MADVYMEAQCGDEEYAPPQELHRFLVHCRDGGRLETIAQKRSAAFALSTNANLLWSEQGLLLHPHVLIVER